MASLITTFGTMQRRSRRAAKRPPPPAVTAGDVSTEVACALSEMELLARGDVPRSVPLASSRAARVYRVDLAWGRVCLKQAVAHDDAMVDTFTTARAGAEVAWLKVASSVVPGAAPAVLGSQPRRAAFASDYLDPAEFPSWQSQLASGQVDHGTATELGHLIGRLHAASANSIVLAERFAMQTAFRALCLEPLFAPIALEQRHHSAPLAEIAEELTTLRIGLVHGGLTPDNVLAGPRGPVLIDADCAHYGDPMFDVATCLAALATRMAAQRELDEALAASFDAFRHSYFAHVTWEMPQHAEARAARLVPVLLAAALANEQFAAAAFDCPREASRALLTAPPARLEELAQTWRHALAAA